jgi:cbb3-type cytochrome oxidase maturation protein
MADTAPQAAQSKSMTIGEGGTALALTALAFVALVVAAKAYTPAYALHAYLFTAASAAAVIAIVNRYYERPAMLPPLVIDGKPNYNMGPVKFATIAAVVWGIAGLHGRPVGGALELALPALNLDLPWTSFGRIQPLHTSAVIFAFGGNVLLATSFYVVQRTCRARLAGDIAPWFVVLGYNFFIVIAGTGYLLGITQSKEYAEPEWLRGPVAHRRVGGVPPGLSGNGDAAYRAAHLCGELVVPRLHSDDCGAASWQQRCDSVLAVDPVLDAVTTARKVRSLMRQNLILAMIYNMFAIPIAVVGLATPSIAALASPAPRPWSRLTRCACEGAVSSRPPPFDRRSCHAIAIGRNMNVLVYLVPLALALGLTRLAAFLWSRRAGQYSDLDGAALRILSDDDISEPR